MQRVINLFTSNVRGNLPVSTLYSTRTDTSQSTQQQQYSTALYSLYGAFVTPTRSGVSRAMDPNQVSVYEGKQLLHELRDATSPDSGTWCPSPSACQHFLQPNAGDTAAVVDVAESCMRRGDFSALARALDLWQRGRRVGFGDCCFSNMLLTHLPPFCANQLCSSLHFIVSFQTNLVPV